jgi:hypothetical protein
VTSVADATWTNTNTVEYQYNVDGDFDVNDDGYDDYLLPTPNLNNGSYTYAGGARLVFSSSGRASGPSP